MKKLTSRWYYTLIEIAELYANNDGSDDSEEFELPIDIPPTDGLAEFCGTIAGIEGAISEDSPWGNIDNELNQEMWAEYLWPEFRDASLLYVDQLVNPWELTDEEAPNRDEVWEVLKPILPRIVRWLKESTERYGALIAAYRSVENKLMGKVETVSNDEGQVQVNGASNNTNNENRLELHNDTPQDGGDFTTDPYVSDARKVTASNNGSNVSNSTSLNSSSTTVGSDVATPIERLDEVRKKLHNLFVDWADEFSKFIIYAD